MKRIRKDFTVLKASLKLYNHELYYFIHLHARTDGDGIYTLYLLSALLTKKGSKMKMLYEYQVSCLACYVALHVALHAQAEVC